MPITCESGRQLFDLRLYRRPASALLLCLAAVLLLDGWTWAWLRLPLCERASGRKLSNGADNMYDLHDHRFVVVSSGRCPWLWTWAASQWRGHTIVAFCSLPVDVSCRWFGGGTVSRSCRLWPLLCKSGRGPVTTGLLPYERTRAVEPQRRSCLFVIASLWVGVSHRRWSLS